MSSYTGLIGRQGLVDFCQTLAKKARDELDREQTLLAEKGKTMSDEQFETLTLSCSSLIGEITALRAVTEWARKQVEHGKFD
jgi:hypothetical protein